MPIFFCYDLSDDVLSLSESLRSQKLHSTTSRLTSRELKTVIYGKKDEN